MPPAIAQMAIALKKRYCLKQGFKPKLFCKKSLNIYESGKPEHYFRGAAGTDAEVELPRSALKNSEEDGSTTMTSDFLLKLAL